MTTYYISTDDRASAVPEEFASLADALEDFEAPAWVRDADAFKRWLTRVGGYGFIEIDDVRVVEVPS